MKHAITLFIICALARGDDPIDSPRSQNDELKEGDHLNPGNSSDPLSNLDKLSIRELLKIIILRLYSIEDKNDHMLGHFGHDVSPPPFMLPSLGGLHTMGKFERKKDSVDEALKLIDYMTSNGVFNPYMTGSMGMMGGMMGGMMRGMNPMAAMMNPLGLNNLNNRLQPILNRANRII